MHYKIGKLFASFHLLQLWGLGMTTTVIRPFHSSVRFLRWKAKLRSKIVIQFFIIIHRQHWHPNVPRSQCGPKMSARLHPCSDDGLSLACYRHFTCVSLPFPPVPCPHRPSITVAVFLFLWGHDSWRTHSSVQMEMNLFFSHQRSCCLYVDIDLVMLLGIS